MARGNDMAYTRPDEVCKGRIITRDFMEFCATDSGLPASKGRAILDGLIRAGDVEFDTNDRVYRWVRHAR